MGTIKKIILALVSISAVILLLCNFTIIPILLFVVGDGIMLTYDPAA